VPRGVRAGTDAGRTRAAEGNGRRPIVCTRNRTDPISGCAKMATLRVIEGLTRDYLPVAALGLAMHQSQIKALRLRESAVAAVRVEPGAQVPGKPPLVSPVAEVQCGCAALPAHSKTKQTGIHKEPIFK